MTIMTGSEPAAIGGVGTKAPNPTRKAATNPRGVAVMLAFKPTGGQAHKSDKDKTAHRR